MSKNNIQRLSVDELQCIFGYLNICEKSICYRVCSEWSEIIFTPLAFLEDFEVFLKHVKKIN